MNQKGFTPILVVLGIIGAISIALGAYYTGTLKRIDTQSQNPVTVSKGVQPTILPSVSKLTSSNVFKEYANSALSFKYPGDWILDSSKKDLVVISKKQYENVEGGMSEVQSNISVYSAPVPNGTTLNGWLKQEYFSNDQNLFDLTLKLSKKKIVAGLEGLEVQIPGAAGYDDQGVIMLYKGYIYDIHLAGVELSDSQQAFQTVLSTFKFKN